MCEALSRCKWQGCFAPDTNQWGRGWKLPDLRGVSCPLCPLLKKSTGARANPHGYWLSPMSPVSPTKKALAGVAMLQKRGKHASFTAKTAHLSWLWCACARWLRPLRKTSPRSLGKEDRPHLYAPAVDGFRPCGSAYSRTTRCVWSVSAWASSRWPWAVGDGGQKSGGHTPETEPIARISHARVMNFFYPAGGGSKVWSTHTGNRTYRKIFACAGFRGGEGVKKSERPMPETDL